MTSSPPVVHADDDTRAEILAVEERRCRALVDVDLATLEDLYDESLVHTHAPGLTHDRSQLLAHVATRQAYRGISRGALTIRLVGDVAIVTGRIRNRLGSPDGSERVLGGQVIQVLRRCEDGAWRFLSFQMTPDGQQAFTMTDSERASAEQAERGAITVDVSASQEDRS
jgi:ketosteroid isomerase-like protein